MASEALVRRARRWYGKLLRFYPRTHRARFGEGLEQTFHDLCRDQIRAQSGFLRFVLWAFFETATSIVKENVRSIVGMKQDSKPLLKLIKYSAITISALMVTGIITLMILARGKGEDIAGIVAMALLVTIASSVVAIVAAVLQKKAQKP
jgi:hypothetical protein